MAAPPGNLNAASHGMRTEARFSMRLGKLPKAWRAVEVDVNKFRRSIEDAVETAHGGISLTQACIINSACRFERHSRLALRWLVTEELAPADRIRFSAEVAKASESRDKSIKLLDLDADSTGDIWANLHQPEQPTQLAQQAGEPKSDDTSHPKPQQATVEPSSSLLDASHPQGLAKSSEAGVEDLTTRRDLPASGYPEVSTSTGKIVSSSDDNESPVDRDIEFQQTEESK